MLRTLPGKQRKYNLLMLTTFCQLPKTLRFPLENLERTLEDQSNSESKQTLREDVWKKSLENVL